MKALIVAAAVAAISGSASAAELGLTGISVGATTTAEYNVDAETFLTTVEPVVGYTVPVVEVDFFVATELNIFNEDGLIEGTFEVLPTLDFTASREMGLGLVVYGEVSYDLEAEQRSDVILGATFAF